ncbi:MAG: hypothetical protein ACFB9M_02390 [Myxococcota bacterium]
MRWLGAAVFFWMGCSTSECSSVRVESNTACASSRDCAEEGLVNLSCVNGRCALPCVRDADCTLTDVEEECPLGEGFASAFCSDQVCTVGCPAVPCGGGQPVCVSGRCGYFFEGFERDEPAALEVLGWNGFGTLRNPSHELALDCAGTACGGEDPRGPASEGERFAVFGTASAPEKGTASTGPTCRACACCVDCRLDPPAVQLSVLDCPRNASVPPRLYCGPPRSCSDPVPPEPTPSECRAVCDACEACPDAEIPPSDPLLSACEVLAASKTCAACRDCDVEACRECRNISCEEACEDPLDDACASCEAERGCPCASCRDCTACDDARTCASGTGGGPACQGLADRCAALGADGCFQVPQSYPRAQLTDAEQALTSPPIDLSAARGTVHLQFDYVPFNVGDSFREPEQGVSACLWPLVPQTLQVQFCRGDCERPENWQTVLDGLPMPQDRNNGLRLGGQSGVDWRAGRVEVDVPESFWSSRFRFRFLPRLSAFTRIGVDRIWVRQVPSP